LTEAERRSGDAVSGDFVPFIDETVEAFALGLLHNGEDGGASRKKKASRSLGRLAFFFLFPQKLH
jgi:hypothetical protein